MKIAQLSPRTAAKLVEPTRRQRFNRAASELTEFKDSLTHNHDGRESVLGCLKCDTNLVLIALDNLKKRHFKTA